MEIGDSLHVVEVWENLSRVYSLAQPPPSPTQSNPHPPTLCVFIPLPLWTCQPQSHRPSLIIEDGLPLSWAVPSLPRPHQWLPVPQAGEAHLVLQPWHRAQVLLGMDVHTSQANLVNPAFLCSLCLCLCVCDVQLHNPLLDNLPLINKLPF